MYTLKTQEHKELYSSFVKDLELIKTHTDDNMDQKFKNRILDAPGQWQLIYEKILKPLYGQYFINQSWIEYAKLFHK